MVGLEHKCVVFLIALSLMFNVIALSYNNWMNGYYGDVVAVTLCPWRICHLSCLRCSSEKPTMQCYWIKDWEGTGFETFSVVSHLEYWCVGFLTLALMVSVLDLGQSYITRFSKCHIDLSKPILLVLIVNSLLSTLSASLFGVKLHHKTTSIATLHGLALRLAWPFVSRLGAVILTWGATVASLCSQCQSTTKDVTAEGESLMVVSSQPDWDYDDYDSFDEAENGTLL